MLNDKNLSSRSLTRKGLNTRATILEKAAQVFRDQGYYGASISEISRRSGLSQGTFYQYFRNKEQVFLELHDAVMEKFHEKTYALPGEDIGFEASLYRFVGLLFSHFRENRFFHHILGEFELIDSVTIGYYASLARFIRGFFRRAAVEGSIRPLDPVLLAYGVLGMAAFHAVDWEPEADQYDPPRLVELTVDLILKGIGGPKKWNKPKNLGISAFSGGTEASSKPEKSLSQGQLTKKAIFQAAEKVFGKVGLNGASIAEITRTAGVAQGTFYIHFKSKGDLMEGFVRYLSHEMRRELKESSERVSDRRDKEREGILAFFRFLQSHRKIYRVVPESEATGRELAMWYYNKLAKGYTEGLAEGVKRGEIRDLPAAFMARSLMGFNHMIGLKWLVWDSSPHAHISSTLLNDAVSFVLEGLYHPGK